MSVIQNIKLNLFSSKYISIFIKNNKLIGSILKNCSYFLFLFICNEAFANQVLCFKSINSKTQVIRLKFIFPDDNSNIAKIKYEKGSKEIIALRIKEEILPPKKNIPAIVQSTFEEKIDKKETSIYQLTTQGAIIGELIYKSKNKKIYKFTEDIESTGMDSCTWENL